MANGLDGLPERINMLLAERDMTRQELADALGIAYTTVCGYVTGSRIPPVRIFIAMAEGFEVSLDYLIRGIGEETEET